MTKTWKKPAYENGKISYREINKHALSFFQEELEEVAEKVREKLLTFPPAKAGAEYVKSDTLASDPQELIYQLSGHRKHSRQAQVEAILKAQTETWAKDMMPHVSDVPSIKALEKTLWTLAIQAI